MKSTATTGNIEMNNNNNNWKDPSVYRFPKNENDDEDVRPRNYCDYRNLGGPLLSYVWCSTGSEPITNVINTTTTSHNNVDVNTLHSNDTSNSSCNNDEHNMGSILQGQTLYLGAEISSYDHCMYCIPGHADRVLKIDPRTDCAIQIGPKFIGKYKWLRGVELNMNGTIYGLPCHSDTVLKIDVMNNTITELQIQYEIFFPHDADSAHEERHREWKYHGGNISPIDKCIYAIPQSALYVLKIDPTTDICTLIGPKLDGKYKFYGGVIGKQDGAIYGIPHNSPHVLRIHPIDGITLHGQLHNIGTHKWHGGAAASNGVIVCVAANADTILCITPTSSMSSEPILTLIGNDTVVQSGRHRNDRKYKYLGATTGPDGRVYCFPCAAEYVLAVDTVQMSVHQIGPNIYDSNMERLCQNKWQNGVYIKHCNRIYGIPLAAESLLQIDFHILDQYGNPTISTWPIPAPYRNMGKWEGAVVSHNGIAYGIPNNHKASLRIESSSTTTTTTDDNNNDSDVVHDVNNTTMTCPTSIASNDLSENDESNLLTYTTHDDVHNNNNNNNNKNNNDRPDYSNRDDLIYKSGIPTLRASAHRVKFSPKSRTNNPCPKNHMGIETGTLWLPNEICKEYVFSYDTKLYNFNQAIYNILQRCDTNIVGYFRDGSTRLEDFVVPTKSTWRIVNGGQCEDAQKYLSDIISNDNIFLQLFDDFVTNVILCNLKERLISLFSVSNDTPMTFYYQRPPTLRLQPGPAWAQVKAHNDVEYGHQYGELNFWIPLTDRIETGVDLYSESLYNNNDYHPIIANIGDIISFHGSSCRHYVNTNSSQYTRVSFDFRVGVQGYFDPNWEMQGTNDDHSRKEITI